MCENSYAIVYEYLKKLTFAVQIILVNFNSLVQINFPEYIWIFTEKK